MKRITRLIVTTLVCLAPLYGQWVFVEPTIANYAPKDYSRDQRVGFNAGLNLPAGLQVFGGYSVWGGSKETISSDTTTGFKFFDSTTSMTFVSVGVRENFRLRDSKINIRIGITFGSGMTSRTNEHLRFTDLSFVYAALGSVVILETGLAIDTENGGQLFLGVEYTLGNLSYYEYTSIGFPADLKTINTDRAGYGLDPLTEIFVIDGFNFKISYSITLGI